MKPHKHAELIKLWADGNKIQWRGSNNDMEWMDVAPIWWDEDKEYRVKPAAPKWPKTTMTDKEIDMVFIQDTESNAGKAVANAAIAHACETGQVVPADKVREIEAKARAEGIKEGRCQEWDRRNSGGIHNRVGAQIGQSIGQAQYADAVARGLTK